MRIKSNAAPKNSSSPGAVARFTAATATQSLPKSRSRLSCGLMKWAFQRMPAMLGYSYRLKSPNARSSGEAAGSEVDFGSKIESAKVFLDKEIRTSLMTGTAVFDLNPMPGSPAPWTGNFTFFTRASMITAVIPRNTVLRNEGLLEELLHDSLIRKVIVAGANGGCPLPPRCEALACDAPASGRTWNDLLARVATSHLLYFSRPDVRIDPRATGRLLAAAEATGAGIVYADYAELRGETLREHPLNDYQIGSIRDGFDFGPLILISTRRRPPGATEIRGDPVHIDGRAGTTSA